LRREGITRHLLRFGLTSNFGPPIPQLALARIGGTARHRRLFASIEKPIKKLKRGVRDEELIALIQHLGVLPPDFDLPDSNVADD
jgi:hypothetical protein